MPYPNLNIFDLRKVTEHVTTMREAYEDGLFKGEAFDERKAWTHDKPTDEVRWYTYDGVLLMGYIIGEVADFHTLMDWFKAMQDDRGRGCMESLRPGLEARGYHFKFCDECDCHVFTHDDMAVHSGEFLVGISLAHVCYEAACFELSRITFDSINNDVC